jgi:uncharacterized protein with FMN-binding domain
MAKSKSKGSLIVKILLGILLTFALVIGGFVVFLLTGKENTLNIKLKGINLQTVQDGTYVGHYSGYRWSNTVEVAVKDHKITNIGIKEPQVFAKKENIQKLIDRVVSKQSTDVDAVTGASADSKAFLQAVENALNK